MIYTLAITFVVAGFLTGNVAWMTPAVLMYGLSRILERMDR